MSVSKTVGLFSALPVVAFSSKLGPLSAAEIVAKKAELQVVELESGHYSLCRQGENTWEDINL